MGKSHDLYEKAKYIIPGATQLLSKRAERFAPGVWPSYYSKAKGCEVWDLDNNHYYDFASMGIGACSLGYANQAVNNAVIKAINTGNMCTLNCPEEIELAEILIDLHPWADMVRFTRTGGEACSVAVRIARAATNRSKIVFCGYHGWHDWYISANLGNNTNLDHQLLPNITSKGVPIELKETAIPFFYNDVENLKSIMSQYGDDVAGIIFEPQRGTAPTKEFLGAIKECAINYNCPIICDEITSGFRMNIGGIHMIYDFQPDIAVFGKTIANGYPMAAIIGKKSIMQNAEESFISSAFWTEKIGPSAAIESIKQMKLLDSPNKLNYYGNNLNNIWRKCADETNIKIHISGIPPLTHLDFDYPNNNEIQTLYVRLMIEKGFLVGPSVYTTIAYTDEIIERFSQATFDTFRQISDTIKTGKKIFDKKEIRSDAFTRLVY